MADENLQSEAVEDSSSIQAAANRIVGLMGRESDTPESQDETPSDNTEGEAPEAKAEEAPETKDEPEPEESRQPQKHRVKTDSGEIEVTLDDLKAGYLRHSDYTRKTQAVAEDRKALQAVQQAVAAERQRYAEQLEMLSQTIPQVKEPDRALLQTDPLAYLAQKDEYDRAIAMHQRVAMERHNLRQQQEQESRQKLAETLQREHASLIEALPTWKDAGKAKAERDLITSDLKTRGYSEQEIAGLSDHRAVLLAREAMLYRQLMSRKTEVEKKVKNVPPVMKPGAAKDKPSANEKVGERMAQLKKSGSLQDAASVLRAMRS